MGLSGTIPIQDIPKSRREIKREDYLDRKHHWLEEIKQRREQARAEVGELRHDIDMTQGEIAQASMGRRSFTASFFAHISNLEAAGNHLIGIYRDANRRVRTTPAPLYFEQRWQLTQTEVPVPSEIDPDLIRKQVEGITASLSDALSKIHEMHDETIRAFDRFDTQSRAEQQRIRVAPVESQPQPLIQTDDFAPSQPSEADRSSDEPSNQPRPRGHPKGCPPDRPRGPAHGRSIRSLRIRREQQGRA
jgi:hypothetical protein